MKKRALAIAAIAAAALLMTGCSGGSGDSGSTGDGGDQANGDSGSSALEVTTLNMGVVPVADAALAYIALDEGYFAEEGLEVKMEAMQNAAAIVPGVLNGQVQIGQGAVPPIVSAASQSLPLVIVGNAANVPQDADADPMAILVKAGSDIRSPKDLEGEIVAVNALQAAIELIVSQAIESDGGDPSTVTYVAMPFPDMAAAVERGDVAAAGVIEPFRATGFEAGLVSISNPMTEGFDAGVSHAVYFASKEFAEKSPNTLAAYDRAIQRAAEAATADPALVRAVLVKYGNLPEPVAEMINLPAYDGSQVAAGSIETFIEIMEAHGFIDAGSVKASDLLVG
ncbi:MAG: ABC transporter substrate-binding protein [Leucobacter sp.]